ncbi:D-arabitol-phosphate dehydrogenase [Crateriforma conspicua]|uniref:D-arabitol-phosphate dehydrogenase n=1 Tax=Crateriforma conspicua TaxID=2527996 RepID=A0A5C6FND3_9PLAN|nr:MULTISPECIES: zinc-binding dehydrogenase [Crateriforma]TWU64469.1 D-arabitol-phosphate dehydrogenase [Crateriforma conspicua]
MSAVPSKMTGVVLPGNSTVEFREYDVPTPGHGQVLLKTKASSICGSDIRAIYREHLGKGPEAYQGVIAGHEPCGQVVQVGPGCRERQVGDRVVLYHISGCGVCEDCMHGYQISCTSTDYRKAYGWQRDGGHAEYMLADEADCIPLPEPLTYVDGAFMACGFGTAWECLDRMKVNGKDRLLITGLGPVGLAAAQLGRALGAYEIIGVDLSDGRMDLAKELEFAPGIPLVDHVFRSDDAALDAIKDVTGGKGAEVSIDCSGAAPARLLALQGTRQWGRCGFVGEGGTVEFDVSPYLIHEQITLFGSWVTSRKHLADLANLLAARDVHPESTAGRKLPLSEASLAYDLSDKGQEGKVCIVFD